MSKSMMKIASNGGEMFVNQENRNILFQLKDVEWRIPKANIKRILKGKRVNYNNGAVTYHGNGDVTFYNQNSKPRVIKVLIDEFKKVGPMVEVLKVAKKATNTHLLEVSKWK